MKTIMKSIFAFPFVWVTNRNLNSMKASLVSLLGNSKIGYVDIGASGGLEPRWRPFSSLIKVFAFEPDKRSFDDLQPNENYIVFNVALSGTKGIRDFHICKKPQVSSMLKPNKSFIDLYPDTDRWEVLQTISFPTVTMDECLASHKNDIDFIKLDTQGLELDILKGSDEILNSSLIGLEVEMEFVQLYNDQPIFGGVVAYLESKKFQFIDFTHIQRWERFNFCQTGQAVFCDGLFLKTPEIYYEIIKSLPLAQQKEKSIKYISILSLYHRSDLIRRFLALGAKDLLKNEIHTIQSVLDSLEKESRRIHSAFRISNFILKLLSPRYQTKIFS